MIRNETLFEESVPVPFLFCSLSCSEGEKGKHKKKGGRAAIKLPSRCDHLYIDTRHLPRDHPTRPLRDRQEEVYFVTKKKWIIKWRKNKWSERRNTYLRGPKRSETRLLWESSVIARFQRDPNAWESPFACQAGEHSKRAERWKIRGSEWERTSKLEKKKKTTALYSR